MRLQIVMERRGIFPEERHLLNKRWSDIWDLPGKDKKIWLREVIEPRKCEKWDRDR